MKKGGGRERGDKNGENVRTVKENQADIKLKDLLMVIGGCKIQLLNEIKVR